MTDSGSGKPATDLFDQWLAHREGRTPEQDAAPEPEPTPEQPEPTPEPQVQPPVAPEPGFPPLPTPSPDRGVPGRAASLPHTIFFKPRSGGKQILGLLLLVFLALTVIAAVWAWSDRTYLSYGITAVAALVTATVWATRASATPVRLTLHGSELEIVRDGSRALFDLAAKHTPIEVQGEPGDRRWRVLIMRRSMSPYIVDATMVDPTEFTRVLRYFRPEV